MTADYDGRVRGFPAFPRGTRVQRSALSWWGNAWIAAMEDSALDLEPLTKGRAYSYGGHVGSVTVSPGRAAAAVSAPDGSTYDTVVTLETLDDAQWQRFTTEVASQAGHIGALLDGEMPHDLAGAADDAGLPMLPGLGDLEGHCSCDELMQPCRHAAALCYQVARLLDEDPFVLLLLRGRSKGEVLEQLRAAHPPLPSAPAELPAPVTFAREAFGRPPAPLPDAPPLPAAGPPAVHVASALGVDRHGIRWLVADAAARAHEWLLTGEAPVSYDVWRDAVRLVATVRDVRVFTRLRDACGRPDELARAARAWEYGGAAGLDVLETPRPLTKGELVSANVSMAAAWDDEDAPAVAVSGNRWTLVGRGLQLRYGRDQRWYPYRDEGGEWWPAGAPQTNPAHALSESR